VLVDRAEQGVAVADGGDHVDPVVLGEDRG
jgi:hypothetical protein